MKPASQHPKRPRPHLRLSGGRGRAVGVRRDMPRPSLPPAVKRVFRLVFMPPGPIAALVVVVAALALVWAFSPWGVGNPLAYAAYALSAYALALVCAYVARRRPVERALAAARRNRFLGVLVDDRLYRLSLGIRWSLLVDVFWAVVNFAMGVSSWSLWFVTLGVYYLLLAVERLMLARPTGKGAFGSDMRAEHRAALGCGVLVAVTIFALSGVVVLVIRRIGGFSYPENLIYGVAAYAFYSLASSTVDFVRLREHESPALRASACVNLVVALVSMFTLEVAMLTTFDGGDQTGLRLPMLAATGGAVALLVLALGLSLAVRSGRALKRMGAGEKGDGAQG